MTMESQEEPRNETASVRVSRTEKAALRLVSAFDVTTEDALLRNGTIDDVVRRAAYIRTLEPAPEAA